MTEHNGNDAKMNAPFIAGIDEASGDIYMDEPYPTSAGRPIGDSANTAEYNINHVVSPAVGNDARHAVHTPPAPHAAQQAFPDEAHYQAVPQNSSDIAVSQIHYAQDDREFKPSPILVPVPNPVGRSKIRKEKQRRKRMVALSAAAIVVLAILILFLFPWDRTITINGQEFTVKAHTTLQQATDAKGISVEPGDLLAIDGSLIEAGAGTPYTFNVNGSPEPDHDYELKQGDIVEVSDGVDITEEYTEETVETSAPVVFDGVGAVHEFTGEGQPGTSLRKIGAISGITIDAVQTEPTTETMKKYNIDSGDDKVIALTFDDGPWKDQTTQVLDVLAENNAKATFFTVGERIAGLEDVIKRAHDEGHQICTHTWDHASGSGQGVNLDYMTDDEQREEISKGLEAISRVTGEEASKVIRVPGGNLSENTARILSEFATSEMGWNIDTNDWRKPGAQAIFSALLQATPGDIILMHDGGGDRSQTIQALRDALPALAEQGYRFITIDELLANYSDNGEESS